MGSPESATARRCRRLGLAALLAWPLTGAFAQTPPPSADPCRAQPIGTARVSAVADGRSFLLEDGREIRLPGIEVPLLPDGGETGAHADAGNAARAALAAMLAGQTVELRENAPAPDRYGRRLAHAYFMREGAQKSAANEMLDQGFARVSAQVGSVACATELLAREAAARKAKLGLWGEAYYAIVGAENLRNEAISPSWKEGCYRSARAPARYT